MRQEKILPAVQEILNRVKNEGDAAVRDYTKRFDGVDLDKFEISQEAIQAASARVPDKVKDAFHVAAANIEKFHRAQMKDTIIVETMPGLKCSAETRPIARVGLYIPGGTAPLPSTVLMLGIPARLAGCSEIVMCTPPGPGGQMPDVILYAVQLCGMDQVFAIGGAQAIAAMAFGTESVPKVDKIFGPGNQYVTAAKMLASIEPDGPAIDLPAGPTEVLVIADEVAKADFIAADLLSQAEHGADSQVILGCTNDQIADDVLAQLQQQLTTLPRQKIAKQALDNSFVLIVSSVQEGIDFANSYAPEHLILNVTQPEKYLSLIQNAGSVFLGQYSPESAGDYASGTNHTLPTSGYARAYSGVSAASFQKTITFQQLTQEGARQISSTVRTLAEQENLEGHRRAMEMRL